MNETGRLEEQGGQQEFIDLYRGDPAGTATSGRALNATGVSMREGAVLRGSGAGKGDKKAEGSEGWNSPLHDLGILGQVRFVGAFIYCDEGWFRSFLLLIIYFVPAPTPAPTSPHLAPTLLLYVCAQNAVVGVADYGLDYTSCFFRDPTAEVPTFTWDKATREKNRKKGIFEAWESETHRKVSRTG